MKTYLLIILILLIYFFNCVPVTADNHSSSNEIVHKASGLILYKEFGNWIFSNSQYFTEDELNVGYSFDNLSEHTLKGTFYICPAGSNLKIDQIESHFNEALIAALSYSKNSQLVFEDTGTYSRDGNSYQSCFGIFDFDLNGERMSSFLIIYYIKNWYIKIRISYKINQLKKVSEDIELFLMNYELPVIEYSK